MSGVKHITLSNIIKKKEEGFLGVVLCFQFTFTAEQPVKIPIKTSHTDSCFYVVRDDEKTMFLRS